MCNCLFVSVRDQKRMSVWSVDVMLRVSALVAWFDEAGGSDLENVSSSVVPSPTSTPPTPTPLRPRSSRRSVDDATAAAATEGQLTACRLDNRCQWFSSLVFMLRDALYACFRGSRGGYDSGEGGVERGGGGGGGEGEGLSHICLKEVRTTFLLFEF